MAEAQRKRFKFPYYFVLQKSEGEIFLLEMLNSLFENKAKYV